MKYLLRNFLPGVALIAMAFWAGSHPHFLFGLVGFLAFFLAGVVLIVEGQRLKRRE